MELMAYDMVNHGGRTTVYHGMVTMVFLELVNYHDKSHVMKLKQYLQWVNLLWTELNVAMSVFIGIIIYKPKACYARFRLECPCLSRCVIHPIEYLSCFT